jgi:uncharacterized membrane protein (UPF0127 family)
MKPLMTIAAVLAVLALSASASAQQAMPTTDLSVGMYRIEAEVAATQPNRELGLMHRKSMPAQHGMLFVFDRPARHCMWMRNTLLPLAVAFLDEQARIINIEEMQPQTDDNHCAAAPAKFALEMNAGWYKSRGFGPGTVIHGIIQEAH